MARPPVPGIPAEERLENRRASTVVADMLRMRIMDGGLPGGERVRQDAMAARFGVSQTVVREAFNRLVAEGLLKAEPRRGVSVPVLTMEEVVEITQLRGLLEPQALEWAIPQMTKADIKAAADVLAELDRARTTDAILSLNGCFHDALFAAAGRERTLGMIADLRLGFERYLRFTWTETDHLDQSQQEHRQLLDLCAARDVAAASAHLKRHIHATGALLVERLRARAS